MIGGYVNPYSYGNPAAMQDMGYQQPMQQSPQQIQQPMQQVPQQRAPQIIDGGFITVQSIDEAKSYPVARGTCVTFKVENAPYICTKVMGFSMLDQPFFKKFRLTEENDEGEVIEENAPKYVTREEHEELMARVKKLAEDHAEHSDQIRKLSEELNKIKTRKRPKVREDEEYED